MDAAWASKVVLRAILWVVALEPWEWEHAKVEGSAAGRSVMVAGRPEVATVATEVGF